MAATAHPARALDRVLPWLLAVGRELGAPLGFVPAAARSRAMPSTLEDRFGSQAAFSTQAHDHDAWRLDAAAGCEFVDDQIRHAK
jgi:hypothetical protein